MDLSGPLQHWQRGWPEAALRPASSETIHSHGSHCLCRSVGVATDFAPPAAIVPPDFWRACCQGSVQHTPLPYPTQLRRSTQWPPIHPKLPLHSGNPKNKWCALNVCGAKLPLLSTLASRDDCRAVANRDAGFPTQRLGNSPGAIENRSFAPLGCRCRLQRLRGDGGGEASHDCVTAILRSGLDNFAPEASPGHGQEGCHLKHH